MQGENGKLKQTHNATCQMPLLQRQQRMEVCFGTGTSNLLGGKLELPLRTQNVLNFLEDEFYLQDIPPRLC